mgnify:CR=1 FL=1
MTFAKPKQASAETHPLGTAIGAGQQCQRVRTIIVDHKGRYIGYLRRRLPSAGDAEDAYQDFCVRALAKAEQIRDAATAEAWLQRVLFTVLQDTYRAKGAEHQGLSAFRQFFEVASQPVPETDQELDEMGICACLNEFLPALKPEYRDVLWQIDFMGKDRVEVARHMRVTASNMRVRLYRARKAFRSVLKQNCPTCAEGVATECHFSG